MQVDIIFVNKNHEFNKIVQNRLNIKYKQKKKIAFLSNKLTLRGTEVNLYNYADYNEKILLNESIIITRSYYNVKNEFDVDKRAAYDKFSSRFNIFYYNNRQEIDEIIIKNNISHLFIEKAGSIDDNIYSNYCKNIIHCVFYSNSLHGDIYTVIGQTINDIYSTNYPVLPYIPNIDKSNENLHIELGIPSDAIVFGRYGGTESFDIEFVHKAIINIVNDPKYNNIYFLFMNTNKFYVHKQIIYVEGTICDKYKRKFINTCNALLHARLRGETYGLTCAEFALCNKPVISYGLSAEREHILILKDQIILYNNYEDIYNILVNYDKLYYNFNMNNNGYMFDTPLNVMKKFDSICLSN